MVLVVFIILLQNVDFVREKMHVFHGHKLKQGLQLPGNTQVAFYQGKIL